VVEENDVGARGGARAGDLLQLAASDQRGRIGLVAPLQDFTDHDCARAGGEFA
jgi:hypothetical protein